MSANSAPPRPRSLQTPAEAHMDLGDLLLSLWLGKIWILLFLSIGLLVGIIHFLNTPRTYQADALIQLEQRGSSIALPEGMRDLAATETRTGTEIEILRSRLVLGQAVSAVNFDWQYAPDNPPYAGEFLVNLARFIPALASYLGVTPGAEALELELLVVPAIWLGRPVVLTVGHGGSFSVRTPDGAERAGRVGELLRDPEPSFALKVASLTALPGRRFVLTQRDEFRSVNAMRQGLTVMELGRQSGILRLAYTGRSREEAERVLNAITQAYVRQNVGRGAAEADSGVDFIRSQLPGAQARLQAAEEALGDYRRRQQSIDLSFETQALLSQIQVIEAELAALQVREDETRRRFTDRHPAYQQLLTERARLQDRLASMQADLATLPGTQRQMVALMRDVEIAQSTYTQLLTRAQELAVLSASTVGSVRVVDSARATPAPVAPRLSVFVGISTGIGLVLGAAFVLLRSWLRTGVESAEDLEAIGLPVFGIIGFSAKERRAIARKEYRILAQSDPMELTVEGFRSLRTSLHFGLSDDVNRTVAITSTHPDAGKSFIAVNLATVAAEAGLRVCLVDADLRRGALRRYFGLSADHPGLSEVLARAALLRDVRVRTPVPGLEFIATGSYPPNPSELLMRRAWPEALEELAKDTDLVIVDCPPAQLLTDATLIAGATGATLLVARQGMTRAVELQAAVKTFGQAGLTVTGSVLNFFRPKNNSADNYYRYRYYSYSYATRDAPSAKVRHADVAARSGSDQ